MTWKDIARGVVQSTTQSPTFSIPATHYPQDGSGPTQILGSYATPSILEDLMTTQPDAPVVVRFEVWMDDMVPAPQRGDQIEINGFRYDVVEVPNDPRDSAATLKLRRNS